MKIRHYCRLSILAAAFFLNADLSFTADLQGVHDEPGNQSAEMRSADYGRYNSRVAIHKPAILPKGIIPARKVIRFPRNEKIRIAEPRIMKIAEPAGAQVKPISTVVTLAQPPVETR